VSRKLTSPAIPQAIGYARVSTEEQVRHGISLDAQEERIRGYCLMAGLELTRIVSEEGVSGAKVLANRPGGGELAAAVASGTVRHVVALKLDRLFRDAENALKQTAAWTKSGVELHLIDLGGAAFSTSSPMGRFFLTVMAACAELERNLIKERTSTALQHKKHQKRIYGPVPYGFERAGEQLEISQGEGETVTQIQKWRSQGKTLRWIAAKLNAAQIAPKRGGAKWYASTVQKILANSIHG